MLKGQNYDLRLLTFNKELKPSITGGCRLSKSTIKKEQRSKLVLYFYQIKSQMLCNKTQLHITPVANVIYVKTKQRAKMQMKILAFSLEKIMS